MTIEQQLRATWKQERRFCHLRGISRCAIWLVMLVLIGLLIDWGLLFKARMPAAVSVLLGLAGSGGGQGGAPSDVDFHGADRGHGVDEV